MQYSCNLIMKSNYSVKWPWQQSASKTFLVCVKFASTGISWCLGGIKTGRVWGEFATSVYKGLNHLCHFIPSLSMLYIGYGVLWEVIKLSCFCTTKTCGFDKLSGINFISTSKTLKTPWLQKDEIWFDGLGSYTLSCKHMHQHCFVNSV